MLLQCALLTTALLCPATAAATTPKNWVAISDDPSPVVCIIPDAPNVQQIFSIDVYTINTTPLIPILRTPMCMSAAPAVDVSIGGQQFNFLNATISETACRQMYERLICNHTRDDIIDICLHAHQIMFAAAQQFVQCKIDTDCKGSRQRYNVPHIWCEWSIAISKDVCRSPVTAESLLPCERNANKATRIKNACIFTSPFCYFLIQHIDILSPIIGISLFLISFTVIYLQHP